MGFSSVTCAKTNLPIMANTSWGNNEMTAVVLVFKDKRKEPVAGHYDGYGRLECADGEVLEDLYHELDLFNDDKPKPKAKLVLAKFWKGETFGQLGENHNDPGQGHFHNSDPLKKWFEQGGFDTYEAYCKAYRAVE